MAPRLRVLFICTGNSARSQMAEALSRKVTGGRVDVFSAGVDPRPEIHPLAREVVRDKFHDEMEGQYPKPISLFVGERFDYVISVCDRAAESCPTFPDDPEKIRWSFPDPADATGTPEEQRKAFERVGNELVGRIRLWMNLPRVRDRLNSDV